MWLTKISLESIANSQIHAPIEKIKIYIFIEQHAITRSKVKLESKRNVELVFKSKDTIHTKFAIIVTISGTEKKSVINTPSPRISQTDTATDESVETFGEMAFVHQVGVQLHGIDIYVAVMSGPDGIFVTEVQLESEMIGEECLVRKGFKVSNSDTNAVFVRSLGENTARHSHYKKEKD